MENCSSMGQRRGCSGSEWCCHSWVSSMFREIPPRTTTHARHDPLQWIMISPLFVRPRAQQGTDLHLESKAPRPPPHTHRLELESTALKATFARVISSMA